MNVGGSSFNRGINFATENHAVKVVVGADGGYKVSSHPRLPKKGLAKWMRKIPLVRGLYALFFSGPPIIPITLLIALAMDFTPAIQSNDTLLLALSLGVTAVLLFYIAKNMLYKLRATWMFHGAEHKTIYAVEHQRELTLANVRACPRVARRCGTNMAVFWLTFSLPLQMLLSHESLAMIISFVLAYELFDLDNGDKLPVIRLFFKLGYWCQQHLFTLEPTDAQLNAAIAAMRKLQQIELSSKNA